MKAVLKDLVARPDFAGKMFSYADHRMWDAANGHAKPGSASMWREWNMAHHITRVVHDLAALSGLSFEDEPEHREPEQLSIFADS